MKRLYRVLTPILALLALVAAVIGIPVALVLLVGKPIPDPFPTSADLGDIFAGRSPIPADYLISVLAIIMWFIWIQVAWATVIETVAAFRGRLAGRAKMVPGVQLGVAKLVTAATFLVTSFTVRPASAGMLVPVEVAQIDDGHRTQGPSEAVDSQRTRASTIPYLTRTGDTWWGIAEENLGSGTRWKELRSLNLGRTMADGSVISVGTDMLRPDWRLLIPSSTAAGPASAVGGPREVMVERGDTIWGIAEADLSGPAADPSDRAVAEHVQDIAAMNREQLNGNPDLIYPGQRLGLPATPEGSGVDVPNPPTEPVRPSDPPPTEPVPSTTAPAPSTTPSTAAETIIPATPPTTAPPLTPAPTTAAPTTAAPTTAIPTTAAPTTVPTTAVPTTAEAPATTATPTTAERATIPTTVPTTAPPTTVAPTSAPPTTDRSTANPVADDSAATTVGPTVVPRTEAPATPTTAQPTTMDTFAADSVAQGPTPEPIGEGPSELASDPSEPDTPSLAGARATSNGTASTVQPLSIDADRSEGDADPDGPAPSGEHREGGRTISDLSASTTIDLRTGGELTESELLASDLPGEAEVLDSDSGRAPIFAGLAALTLIGGYLYRARGRRRESALRHRHPGRRPNPPKRRTRSVARRLSAAAEPEHGEFVNVGLRALGKQLQTIKTSRLPKISGVWVSHNRLVIALADDSPRLSPPAPFTEFADGSGWSLRRSDFAEAQEVAKGANGPLPLLTTIGTTTALDLALTTNSRAPAEAYGLSSSLLFAVDLEAGRVISVQANDEASTIEALTMMALELATSETADQAEIVCVGFGHRLATFDRVMVVDELSEILSDLETITGRAVYASADASPFATRVGNGAADTWNPVIVFHANSTDPDVTTLVELAEQTEGGVTAVCGYPTGSGWTLVVDGDRVSCPNLPGELARHDFKRPELDGVELIADLFDEPWGDVELDDDFWKPMDAAESDHTWHLSDGDEANWRPMSPVTDPDRPQPAEEPRYSSLAVVVSDVKTQPTPDPEDLWDSLGTVDPDSWPTVETPRLSELQHSVEHKVDQVDDGQRDDAASFQDDVTVEPPEDDADSDSTGDGRPWSYAHDPGPFGEEDVPDIRWTDLVDADAASDITADADAAVGVNADVTADADAAVGVTADADVGVGVTADSEPEAPDSGGGSELDRTGSDSDDADSGEDRSGTARDDSAITEDVAEGDSDAAAADSTGGEEAGVEADSGSVSATNGRHLYVVGGETAGHETVADIGDGESGSAGPEIEVSVLGNFTIEGHHVGDRTKPWKYTKTPELILYLMLHPAGASQDLLMEQLFPEQPPNRPRLNQLVSDARTKALGKNSDGEYHLPHASPTEPFYKLLPSVSLDLREFTAHCANARAAESLEVQKREWEAALAMVKGRPFTLPHDGYEWAIPEIEATIVKVEEAAVALADIAFELEDHALAVWATKKGLLTETGYYELLVKRGRAALLLQDPEEIVRAFADLQVSLEFTGAPEEGMPDLSSHPDLEDVYNELSNEGRSKDRPPT